MSLLRLHECIHQVWCFTFACTKTTASSRNTVTTAMITKAQDPSLPNDIFPQARRSAGQMQNHQLGSVKTQQSGLYSSQLTKQMTHHCGNTKAKNNLTLKLVSAIQLTYVVIVAEVFVFALHSGCSCKLAWCTEKRAIKMILGFLLPGGRHARIKEEETCSDTDTYWTKYRTTD